MEIPIHKTPVSIAQATECLCVLARAERPLLAAEIADRMGMGGSHETKRRKVRKVIKHLRDVDGKWIVATLQEGYWLTADREIWRYRNERQKIDGQRIIAEASRRQKMIMDASGQRLLFAPPAGVGVVD